METPRLFFFINRTYCYPTLHLAGFDGRHVSIKTMFLESGVAISGEFNLRVIASEMHGRVDLLEDTGGGAPSWVMLTRDEADMIVRQCAAIPAADQSVAHAATV